MTMKHVSDLDFSSSIVPEGITLVEFGAPWCPPCKALLPILDQLDTELEDGISILKVNVDESPASAASYGIMSMPTVIFFRNGEPVDKLVGLRPKEVYSNIIRKHMGV